LRALGAHAAGAAEAVERVAASDKQPRSDAVRTLACLGPLGLVRLGGLAAERPDLVSLLVQALHSNDDDCAAAASALLQLHYVPTEETCKGLRERLQQCTDRKASSFLMMLLLRADQPASDQDWLKVISLEPAVRQRAVQALGRSASGPLQLGAIVELLDDSDANVRAVALKTLLANPARIAMCRRPLEEFAATAEASVAARVREALATPR
jgi:hypothetical protein